MQKYIHEIFEDISQAENREKAAEKIKFYNTSLPQRDARAFRTILKGILDDDLIWRLPKTDPPYTPCAGHNAPSNLITEVDKFSYLLDNNPKSVENKSRREKIYLQILEGIHPKDAEIVIDMIRGESKFKHINQTVVRLAFGETFFEVDKREKKLALQMQQKEAAEKLKNL